MKDNFHHNQGLLSISGHALWSCRHTSYFSFIIEVLQNFLHSCAIIYIDDILIHSKTEAEHVTSIFEKTAKLEKWEFLSLHP